MPDFDLATLDSKTGAAPKTRIKDAASLNAIVKRIIEEDSPRALSRVDVQKMVDGEPPYNPLYMQQSGQEGRCNLNFGDGKARVKAEAAGYYDLTDSVPTLAIPIVETGDPVQRTQWSMIMAEEWHRMLKDWADFDPYFQLLIQKKVTHGVGFIYREDDVNWKWKVAGLEDFKVTRGVTLSESDSSTAIAIREIDAGDLYAFIERVDDNDKRWSKKEVRQAILRAASGEVLLYSNGLWEKFQEMAKNNDAFVSVTAKDKVKIVHVWQKEFSGKVSHYITLLDASNSDFLFKFQNRFDSVHQAFTFFPYEIGTNGTLHSSRGLAHDIYATVQVLNTLKCQTVDNARLSGSLLLQPNTEADAEDLAILFYSGAAYIPPNVKVQNGNLNNPSTNILPVIQEMSMSMRHNTGDFLSRASDNTKEQTKFEVQSQLSKEAVLPTSGMNLFYQPWGRHLNETWRRTVNPKLKSTDPGGREVFDFRRRCMEREVPEDILMGVKRVMAVRAVGYGSPSNRLLALDEFMQFFGELDPVGQNNLLRDRFAMRVGYGQVDRYVPKIEEGGRLPVDVQIAELQNAAMSDGKPQPVRPNDMHLVHIGSHIEDMNIDLETMESGEGDERLLQIVQMKHQHLYEHMKWLKPDKLNKAAVGDAQKKYNNIAQRVRAATTHFQRIAAKEAGRQPAQSPGLQQEFEEHRMKMQFKEEQHQQKLTHKEQDAALKRATSDAMAAAKIRASTFAARAKGRNGSTPPAVPAARVPAPPAPPTEIPPNA